MSSIGKQVQILRLGLVREDVSVSCFLTHDGRLDG